VVPATYPVPIIRTTMAELKRSVQAFCERQRGHYAIWIEELQSGQTIDLDAQELMPAAAVYHLLLATYCVAESSVGRLDLNRLVTYEPADRATGMGRFQQAAFGERFSLGQLCQYAVVEGDLTAGRLLRKALDPVAIAGWAAAVGLDGFEPERLAPRQAGTLLKAAIRLAEDGINRGGVLLEWLLTTRHSNWAPRFLPWSAPTAHLTGALPQYLHDVGIIFLPRGAYLLAVMSDLSADARLGVGIDNLAQIGGIVYRHLRLVEGMLGRIVACGKHVSLPRPLVVLEGHPTLDATGAALALGAQLEQDALTGRVTLTRGLGRVTLSPDDAALTALAGQRPLPFAPFYFEGELILPLLPVAAALGWRLDWDAERNLAHLHGTSRLIRVSGSRRCSCSKYSFSGATTSR
jgi:beta-lactamase class A